MDFRFLAALGMTGRQKPGSRIITAIPFFLPLPARRGNTLPISPPPGERYREGASPPHSRSAIACPSTTWSPVETWTSCTMPDQSGPESLLHLHRLKDADRVAGHHLVADLDRDRHDNTGHRRLERPRRPRAMTRVWPFAPALARARTNRRDGRANPPRRSAVTSPGAGRRARPRPDRRQRPPEWETRRGLPPLRCTTAPRF